jgi:hypothetical protein
MDYVVNSESGYNPYAVNKSSGACGLPQSLPCSKLLNRCESLDNVDCQIDWLIDYVRDRYKTPYYAYLFKVENNWY